MSDITEKKRINNAINGVEFVLDVVSNENVSYSDSDSEQDSFDSDFRDTKGKGL